MRAGERQLRAWRMSGFAAVCALLGAATAISAQPVINEIRYNSPGSPDVEFVELANGGGDAIDLTGWYLLDDDDAHDRCMLSGTLAPGGYLVVPGRADLFQAAYPSAPNVNPFAFDSAAAGVGFSLGNTNDTVRLFDAADRLVDAVAYQDGAPWPTGPDGDGPSLELANPALDNDVAANWSTSVAPEGTPGEENSTFVADPPPGIDDVTRDPLLPGAGEPVLFVATVADDRPGVAADLWYDTGSGFVAAPMVDDGSGEFSVSLAGFPDGTVVRYYVEATDTLPQSVLFPAGAPGEYLAFTAGHTPPFLRIREVVASNQSGAVDNAGDRDDWVETHNPGPGTVSLAGMFLTNDATETRLSPLPATLLGPGESTLVWCDAEPFQGAFHMTFRLARAGGEVYLYDTIDHGNARVAGYTYGPQDVDGPFGYFPDDGDLPEYMTTPTPFQGNAGSALASDVCINEFQARSAIPAAPDWIELYNRGSATVDLGGWHLSDSIDDPTQYTFPAGTLLLPGDYLSLDSNTLGFNLAGDGESIVLTLPGGEVGRDYVDFGPQLADISRGRFPDGSASWHFLAPPSRDDENLCSGAIPPFEPVAGLRMDDADTLRWNPVAGATAYDVADGELEALRAAGVSTAACAINNVPVTEAYAAVAPAPGSGRFYLVRAVNDACRFGSWESESPSQVPSRDPELAGVCP